MRKQRSDRLGRLFKRKRIGLPGTLREHQLRGVTQRGHVALAESERFVVQRDRCLRVGSVGVFLPKPVTVLRHHNLCPLLWCESGLEQHVSTVVKGAGNGSVGVARRHLTENIRHRVSTCRDR